MSEGEILQVLGDFWPRSRSGLLEAPEKLRGWVQTFSAFEVEDFREAASRWHADSTRPPTINALLKILGQPKHGPQAESPEIRSHLCGTCGIPIREWFHHDGTPPRWRSMGDGGFLFQQREDGLYAVRCHECRGPELNRRGRHFLPTAKEPAAWLPLCASPLGPLLRAAEQDRSYTGEIGKQIAAAIRRTQRAAAPAPVGVAAIGGWRGGSR